MDRELAVFRNNNRKGVTQLKILTKKKVDKVLKRITANEIIVAECGVRNDTEALKQLEENNAEITYIIGGIEGMVKVRNTVSKRHSERGE
jgi:uncharacterized lipoprotein YehR (DUF1307 family)